MPLHEAKTLLQKNMTEHITPQGDPVIGRTPVVDTALFSTPALPASRPFRTSFQSCHLFDL